MIINPGGSMEEKKGSLPTGGTAGQMLTKKSAEDYDAQWQNVPGIPSGLIAMWSGAADNIPSGWALCNGSNGTPDLRDRFIVGAGSSYSVGNTGGSESVTLNWSMVPAHQHWIKYNVVHVNPSASSGTGVIAVNIGDSGRPISNDYDGGGGGPHENRPPYYALCFIMKT